ncbi:hypothetical protein [Pseudoclavibacter helvolus]|uniref:hypothetical protein n=1 Tax=Pseudoclavibacter helvolus TaxID=255205 RepID=UPI003C77BF6F
MSIVGIAWLGPLGAATLAVILTLPVAWLSWTYVERPAMQLRKRLQRREVRDH